jgi:hypothetical protein
VGLGVARVTATQRVRRFLDHMFYCNGWGWGEASQKLSKEFILKMSLETSDNHHYRQLLVFPTLFIGID